MKIQKFKKVTSGFMVLLMVGFQILPLGHAEPVAMEAQSNIPVVSVEAAMQAGGVEAVSIPSSMMVDSPLQPATPEVEETAPSFANQLERVWECNADGVCSETFKRKEVPNIPIVINKVVDPVEVPSLAEGLERIWECDADGVCSETFVPKDVPNIPIVINNSEPAAGNFQPVINEQTARELMAAELNRILERNDFTVDSFEDVVIDGNAIRARIGDITYSANVEWHDRIAQVDPVTGEFYETAGFLIEGTINLSTRIEDGVPHLSDKAFQNVFEEAQQAARQAIVVLRDELAQVQALIKKAKENKDLELLQDLKERQNEIKQALKTNAKALRDLRVTYRKIQQQLKKASDIERLQLFQQLLDKAMKIPAYREAVIVRQTVYAVVDDVSLRAELIGELVSQEPVREIKVFGMDQQGSVILLEHRYEIDVYGDGSLIRKKVLDVETLQFSWIEERDNHDAELRLELLRDLVSTEDVIEVKEFDGAFNNVSQALALTSLEYRIDVYGDGSLIRGIKVNPITGERNFFEVRK